MGYQLIWGARSLTIRLTGKLSALMFREYEDKIWSDPRFDALDYAVWDALEVERLDLPDEEIVAAAAHANGGSATNPDIRLALLVQNTAILSAAQKYVGLSRMLNTPWEVRIFQDRDAGIRWASRFEAAAQHPSS